MELFVALGVLTVLGVVSVGLIASARRFKRERSLYDDSKQIVRGVVSTFEKRVQNEDEKIEALTTQTAKMYTYYEKLADTQISQRERIDYLAKNLEVSLNNDVKLLNSMVKVKNDLNDMTARLEDVGKEVLEKVEALPQAVAPTEKVRYPIPISESAIAKLTQTELSVLTLLGNEGSKPAPELSRAMNKSREHIARLMKKLYDEGYVDREMTQIPYRYKVNDKVKALTAGLRPIPTVTPQPEKEQQV